MQRQGTTDGDFYTDGCRNVSAPYISFLSFFSKPLEFLEFIGRLHGKNSSDVQSFLNENANFVDKDAFSGKYIRELSAGNKNKIGILASFISNPELIILDEPFSNLDPSSQSWLKTKLRDFNTKGTTILISSHDLKHVTDVCSRIILLENGNLIQDINTSSDTLLELEKYFEV